MTAVNHLARPPEIRRDELIGKIDPAIVAKVNRLLAQRDQLRGQSRILSDQRYEIIMRIKTLQNQMESSLRSREDQVAADGCKAEIAVLEVRLGALEPRSDKAAEQATAAGRVAEAVLKTLHQEVGGGSVMQEIFDSIGWR